LLVLFSLYTIFNALIENIKVRDLLIKQFKLMHESGIAIIMGLIVGSIYYYSNFETYEKDVLNEFKHKSFNLIGKYSFT